MKKLKLIIIFLTGITISLLGNEEKKPLSHDDYDDWKSLNRPIISSDGKWVAYQVNPQDGDGILCIYERSPKVTDTIVRGSGHVFSDNSKFIVYRIVPKQEQVRQAKLENNQDGDRPKDTLGIMTLKDRKTFYFSDLKSFKVPPKGNDWMTFIYEHKEEIKKNDTIPEEGKNKYNKIKNDNKDSETTIIDKLVIFNPLEEIKHEFEEATQYHISAKGNLIAFVTEECKDSVELVTLNIFDTETESHSKIFSDEGSFSQIKIDEKGHQLAFVFTSDTNDIEAHALYYFEAGLDSPAMIADSSSDWMFSDWQISPHRRLSFSESGKRLFFGTSPIPEPEPEDTLLDEEKYSLDIWHWQDPKLQPQQKQELSDEKRRSYLAIYKPGENEFFQIEDTIIHDVNTVGKGDARFAVGYNSKPYQIKSSWDISRYRDVYILDIENGEKKKIFKKATFVYGLSPGGKYLVWFDSKDSHWYALNNKTGESNIISEGVDVPLYREEFDQPRTPPPSGVAGWFEDDESILVYDDYDIWQLDPEGKKEPVNITLSRGRDNYNTFRYIQTDREELYIDKSKPIMLSVFNQKTKVSGFCHLYMDRRPFFTNLISDDYMFSFVEKSRDADKILWRKGNFREYNDLYISNPDLTDIVRISDVNPQQDKYLWGDVELVSWTSFNNDTLQGLLYTPENMEPGETYPMLVYFYERSSNTKHRHYTPTPSRSVINRPFCTSNGYVVFVPDIKYKIGYPGQSAYDAVVSGTKSMIERYDFIDADNIGLQGQSWGGYQVAWIITRTNMFNAAMAGTPVSNMISAYGGIRWASGRSRQFQYEQTQSRLGGSLWESPHLYYENSPIFFADKIETPLLIMHNDDDGAVPWYQGIELFTAMRRLKKPAWMLSYDDEAHNLRRRANRIDLSIRMHQFFDHFLKGEKPPKWLKYGIPAIDKGRKSGYELVE